MSEENKYIKVNELSPNVRDINLLAKIVTLGDIREVSNRNTGEEHKVMDVLIADDTAKVLYSAWNEQIDTIKEGETYQFLNAKTILFRGHIRLSLGRNGTIEETKEKIDETNDELDMSEKEHEYERRGFRGGGGQNRRPRSDRY
ncbi:MAG: single-stranded DNA-binding protein [Candidatus Heimdallarchaeota archaeon]|nr:single-stranded DNA-binding protein [Candidatus Heimdallarchaeota archaeon]